MKKDQEPKRFLSCEAPASLADQLDAYAEREGINRSVAMRLLLKRALGRIRVTGTAS